MGTVLLLLLVAVVVISVFLLKGFDAVAGRGPKQVTDGIDRSALASNRPPMHEREREERECPHCAELILRKAKVCKHCGRDVEPVA